MWQEVKHTEWRIVGRIFNLDDTPRHRATSGRHSVCDPLDTMGRSATTTMTGTGGICRGATAHGISGRRILHAWQNGVGLEEVNVVYQPGRGQC